MERISTWILAVRPKTLWASLCPVILGSAVALRDEGFHLPSALAAMVCALLIQIGTNLANDYFDFKKGADSLERVGPTRVTQSCLLPPITVRNAAYGMFILAFICGLYLLYRGGIPIFAIGILSILSGILYTAGPIPLAYVGLGDIFVLLFFGPVAVGGTYYVQTLALKPDLILAGFSPGLIALAILAVNNVRDFAIDKKAGKNTLVVRFGETFGKIEYTASMIGAMLIPFFYMSFLKLWPFSVFILLFGTLGLAVFTIIKPFTTLWTQKGAVLNETLALTGLLLLTHTLLFSAVVLISK